MMADVVVVLLFFLFLFSFSLFPLSPSSLSSSSLRHTGMGTFKMNDTCIKCPRGFSQTLQNQEHCDICLAGKFTHKSGESSCFDCVPGSYQQRQQSTECKSCAQHTYSDASMTNKTECVVCPAGFLTKSHGSTSCMKCEVGKYGISTNIGDKEERSDADPKEAYVRCITCPIGWKRADNDTDPTFCIQCAVGQMTDGEGATSCLGCDFGRSSATAP